MQMEEAKKVKEFFFLMIDTVHSTVDFWDTWDLGIGNWHLLQTLWQNEIFLVNFWNNI